MNSTMEYNFDFSTPGHIQWSSGTQKQEFVMPEQPVRFVINDESIAREFSTVVEPVLADALDVAVAAHMADRLALRERFVGKTRMPVHRSFEMAIAVREPEIWNDDLIKSDLQEALAFLTQDSWQFIFVKREVAETPTASNISSADMCLRMLMSASSVGAWIRMREPQSNLTDTQSDISSVSPVHPTIFRRDCNVGNFNICAHDLDVWVRMYLSSIPWPEQRTCCRNPLVERVRLFSSCLALWLRSRLSPTP